MASLRSVAVFAAVLVALTSVPLAAEAAIPTLTDIANWASAFSTHLSDVATNGRCAAERQHSFGGQFVETWCLTWCDGMAWRMAPCVVGLVRAVYTPDLGAQRIQEFYDGFTWVNTTQNGTAIFEQVGRQLVSSVAAMLTAVPWSLGADIVHRQDCVTAIRARQAPRHRSRRAEQPRDISRPRHGVLSGIH